MTLSSLGDFELLLVFHSTDVRRHKYKKMSQDMVFKLSRLIEVHMYIGHILRRKVAQRTIYLKYKTISTS